jgi:protein-disulfide isomerase
MESNLPKGHPVMSFIKLFFTAAILAASLSAQTCQPLTDKEKSRLEAFVSSWYNLPANQTVSLTDSSTVDTACYRKLVFRASVPRPPFVLYLTPDSKHLASEIMDLTVDPIVARRNIQQETAKKLVSGAWLTSGERDAAVKLAVFSDFQCPYCKRFETIVRELTQEERAGLEISYRQFPLSTHSWAGKAAEVSTCVALQDKAAFWKLHQFLFAEQELLTEEIVKDSSLAFLAHETAIDPKVLETCLASKAFQAPLDRDARLALDLEVMGTPTVFVNGKRVNVRSVEDLRAALREARSETAGVRHENSPKPSNVEYRAPEGAHR